MLPESGESFCYPLLWSWPRRFPARWLWRGRQLFGLCLSFRLCLRFAFLLGMRRAISLISSLSIHSLFVFISRRVEAASRPHELTILGSAVLRMSHSVIPDSPGFQMSVYLTGRVFGCVGAPSAKRTDVVHDAVAQWHTRRCFDQRKLGFDRLAILQILQRAA
jgi:hypothetical protein